jgi:hypothetical protein
MEQIAYLHDVHLRYGCFCKCEVPYEISKSRIFVNSHCLYLYSGNPGACRRHLGHHPNDMLKHYEVRSIMLVSQNPMQVAIEARGKVTK